MKENAVTNETRIDLNQHILQIQVGARNDKEQENQKANCLAPLLAKMKKKGAKKGHAT